MTPPIETDHEGLDRPPSDLIAALSGLLATALACIPPALFRLAADDGPRGAWTFSDARQWVGLSRFCLASLILVVPVLWLARVSGLRAAHWPARIPGAIALMMSLPMIPGAVIQISWWMGG